MKKIFLLILTCFLTSCQTIDSAVRGFASFIQPTNKISKTGKQLEYRFLHIEYLSRVYNKDNPYIANPVGSAGIVGTNGYHDKELRDILKTKIPGGISKTYHNISLPVAFTKHPDGSYQTASHHYYKIEYYDENGNVIGTSNVPLEVKIHNGQEVIFLNLAKYAPDSQKQYCPHDFGRDCNRCGYRYKR